MIEAKIIKNLPEANTWFVHDRTSMSKEAQILLDMIKMQIMHRTEPVLGMHNPDGSQRVSIISDGEIMRRATYFTDEAIRLCRERGWLIDAPSLDEIYSGDKAKVGF